MGNDVLLFSINIYESNIHILRYLSSLFLSFFAVFLFATSFFYLGKIKKIKTKYENDVEDIKHKNQQIINEINSYRKDLQDELKKVKHITNVFTSLISKQKGQNDFTNNN
jgi:F0F1-type ATP synthase membrane subunit b/b'